MTAAGSALYAAALEPTETSWFSTIDWGSAPDWLAAVGTVGALFWALVLFQNERNARRRLDVDRVGVWNVQGGFLSTREIHVHNGGDTPIRVLAVLGEGRASEYAT